LRLKLDENLPASLVADLAALGHDVDTVLQEGIRGCPDSVVFAAAQREQRFLITQDLDFADLRAFAPGSHHGLLLVRLAKPSLAVLRQRLRAVFQEEEVESWRHCFVVATDRKIRVRRPVKG